VLDLTGPRSLTFDDVASAMGKALGRKVSYVPISLQQFRSSLLGAGLPEPAADSVTELFGAFAEGTYAKTTDDVSTMLARPARDIDEFAATLSPSSPPTA
jgi:uncharacterized protein YbjT (DUF2867 family)